MLDKAVLNYTYILYISVYLSYNFKIPSINVKMPFLNINFLMGKE